MEHDIYRSILTNWLAGMQILLKLVLRFALINTERIFLNRNIDRTLINPSAYQLCIGLCQKYYSIENKTIGIIDWICGDL